MVSRVKISKNFWFDMELPLNQTTMIHTVKLVWFFFCLSILVPQLLLSAYNKKVINNDNARDFIEKSFSKNKRTTSSRFDIFLYPLFVRHKDVQRHFCTKMSKFSFNFHLGLCVFIQLINNVIKGNSKTFLD